MSYAVVLGCLLELEGSKVFLVRTPQASQDLEELDGPNLEAFSLGTSSPSVWRSCASCQGVKQSTVLPSCKVYEPQWPAQCDSSRGAIVAFIFGGNQQPPNWTWEPLNRREFMPGTVNLANKDCHFLYVIFFWQPYVLWRFLLLTLGMTADISFIFLLLPPRWKLYYIPSIYILIILTISHSWIFSTPPNWLSFRVVIPSVRNVLLFPVGKFYHPLSSSSILPSFSLPCLSSEIHHTFDTYLSHLVLWAPGG